MKYIPTCKDCLYCEIEQLVIGSSYHCNFLNKVQTYDVFDIVDGSKIDELVSDCHEERENKLILYMLSKIGLYRKRCGLKGKNFKSKPNCKM